MDDETVAAWRREYIAGGLAEDDVPGDPYALFATWIEQAGTAGLYEPNGMVVCTVGSGGLPSSRMVLLKGFDQGGFVFYTNYESRKARELADNPRCALLFPWHPLERQVRVEGVAARLDASASDRYFATRPRGAQLGAWASPQSRVIAGRDELDAAYRAMAERYPSQVPRPAHWGGFRVRPEAVEFWQGRPGRMHDRLRYRRADTARTGWVLERLAP